MFFSSSGGYSFTSTLADETATYRLMTDIAAIIEAGDLITLSGDLGAGKTTFARALIRYLADDNTIEVPSPTFTLTQTYTLPRFAVVHADLYRLSGSAELTELGLDDAPEGAVTLVEWPDRAAGFLPNNRLDIAFTLEPQAGLSARNVRVTGFGSFAPRAERILTIRRFLDRSDFGRAERRRIQGDASTRSYERLTRDGATYVLMNSPKRADGPPVRNGKSYSAMAHLAENVTPFVAMTQALRARGFSAPAIFASDREAGLLVIEDLGDELVVQAIRRRRSKHATKRQPICWLNCIREPVSPVVPVEPGTDYRLPLYDLDAYLIEAELLLDWYLPKLEIRISDAKRENYRALWRDALLPVMNEPQTWVLRDYHSPNLLWLPEREGTARVGLLDFQDAVMGPAAFDVASLLQDARVDVPEKMEIALLSRYTRARRSAHAAFDAPAFARSYATLAAQRASKILGIFARLERRDRKPQYLRHLPRVSTYLQRSLCPSGTGPTRGLVSRQCAPGESLIHVRSTDTRRSPPRHGPGRRTRHSHAAAHGYDAEAADQGRRQAADRSRARSARGRRRRAGRGQCALLRRTDAAASRAPRQRPKIVISDERGLLLGTGGGVKKALPELGDAPFFHVNSDTIWIDGVKPNLARLAESFDPAATDALLLLAPTTDSVGYSGRGDFAMAPDGSLLKRAEQEVAPFVYAGAAVLSPALFKGAPDGELSLTVLFDRAAQAKRLHGLRLEGLWMHVGTPEAIAEAEAAIRASVN